METNRTHSILLILLRAGLWVIEPSKKELALFPLNEEEWQEVYGLAKEQTVIGPVFQGICLLPDDIMPSMDLLQLWVAHVDNIEQMNRKVNKIVGELITFFNEKGQYAIVLKGQGTARLYEHPLQRSCGDIDLYFRTEEERNCALDEIRNLGLSPSKMPDGAYSFKWKSIDIEIHQNLLDIHNPFLQKDIRNLIEKESFNGHLPSPLLHLLLLNTHILKHLMGHGIGLRQFADMARAYHAQKGHYQENEYLRICSGWGIVTWTKEMNGILVQHLGLPESVLPGDMHTNIYTDILMEKILQGGNFGKYSGRRADEYQGALASKWKTAMSMVKNYQLSRKLAPKEALFMVLSLIKGQF